MVVKDNGVISIAEVPDNDSFNDCCCVGYCILACLGSSSFHLRAIDSNKKSFKHLHHLITHIVSDLNFQKLNTLNYHNHSFNEILNLDGVYIIEYIHNGNDHNNIMHTLVVDGYGKNVCDSNYGVVKYKDLNINNYYFLKLVSIYGVSKSYKRKNSYLSWW